MQEQIRTILDKAGYHNDDPTEQNLINCFLDYVDTGFFNNLDYDEVKEDIESGEITLKNIIYNMKMRLR